MKILFKLSFMIMLVSFLASCGPKGEKAATGDAKEVAEATGKAYAVNTANSSIMWEGSKVTGSHNGTIDISEGTINFESGTLTGGSFTIDMNSIKDLDLPEDKQANLVNHLKGTVEGKETDFFNTPKFPTAKFEITKATKLMNNEEGNYVVTGNLTLKDITKSVSFKAMVSEANGKVNVTTPQFTIDRTEWDIKYGSAKFVDGLKDKAINDEIALKINVTAG
ncbi:YceI family protein [Portibacter lacus]|uniref:Lipid-binding protein n=1 Tax=Portibacter lacus TaxID=1099794 RepID=A0AA37SV37_9BACT|nr:YceI family protein [Portibacter lacus]GLR19720.1 lipid-binding protein [Portibacter lacus]